MLIQKFDDVILARIHLEPLHLDLDLPLTQVELARFVIPFVKLFSLTEPRWSWAKQELNPTTKMAGAIETETMATANGTTGRIVAIKQIRHIKPLRAIRHMGLPLPPDRSDFHLLRYSVARYRDYRAACAATRLPTPR